ncbi:hypothetical protein [Streptomyces sp. NPDC051921]|uniref:hypothetical protein n=1 Tax=Streptomyces sp. NPDC051921 TaxID=3155806 RepID=UPI003421EBDA
MGKKQTRVNKGARTGGHEHRATATETRTSPRSSLPEAPRPAIDVPSHRKERKFGHN